MADETGVDLENYFSNKKKEKYGDFVIDSWYDEDANSAWSAWSAFSKGIGTCSRPSREEAIDAVKEKIDFINSGGK